MEVPPHDELERFIDDQLKKLPDRPAPEELIGNVLSVIAARKESPWWRQPFTSWPRGSQGILFAALAALVAAVTWIAWRPAESLTLGVLTEQAASWAWFGRFLRSFADSFALVARALPWQVFAGFALVFCLMYGFCLGTGMALYKVARPKASRAA